MYVIPLTAIPNQRLSSRLDGALFDLEIKAARDSMIISISRNAEPVVQGLRCMPSTPLIPYKYLEVTDGSDDSGATGNFIFITEGNAYPHYSRFGTTDVLYYLSAAELENMRNG